MSEKHKEGHSKSYKKLQGMKTLEEILDVAISFEKTARDFYSGMIPKVSKNIRYLVEELAEEEQEHFDLFSSLKDSPNVKKQLKKESKHQPRITNSQTLYNCWIWVINPMIKVSCNTL